MDAEVDQVDKSIHNIEKLYDETNLYYWVYFLEIEMVEICVDGKCISFALFLFKQGSNFIKDMINVYINKIEKH